jgi:predicted esterase
MKIIKSKLLRVMLIILACLALLAIIFVAWASSAQEPGTAAQNALHSSPEVKVEISSQWITFYPTAKEPQTGFIFYPGGRVDYRSYAPALRLIAEQGYLVVLPSMTLNLAIFNSDKAAAVLAAYPNINHWAIGGHSLGGSMASYFLFGHPEQPIRGLVLWASYPASNNNLASFNIKVLSMFGTEDGVLNKDNLDKSHNLLPASTIWLAIEGGNHGQFGDYGNQSGDNPAKISPESQWKQAAQATINLLKKIETTYP